MHSRPTAGELIHAVQHHLTEKILPALTDPQVRYHTLVAAHVRGIVERELAQGKEVERQEWEELRALLAEDNWPQPSGMVETTAGISEMNTRLAEQILAGEWDDNADLTEVLK